MRQRTWTRHLMAAAALLLGTAAPSQAWVIQYSLGGDYTGVSRAVASSTALALADSYAGSTWDVVYGSGAVDTGIFSQHNRSAYSYWGGAPLSPFYVGGRSYTGSQEQFTAHLYPGQTGPITITLTPYLSVNEMSANHTSDYVMARFNSLLGDWTRMTPGVDQYTATWDYSGTTTDAAWQPITFQAGDGRSSNVTFETVTHVLVEGYPPSHGGLESGVLDVTSGYSVTVSANGYLTSTSGLVPEPTTACLLALGPVGFLARRRRA